MLFRKQFTAMYVNCIKHRVRGSERLDKRMLDLATIGLYGHDGEWLNCLATISKFVTTAPVRPGDSGFFVFSMTSSR